MEGWLWEMEGGGGRGFGGGRITLEDGKRVVGGGGWGLSRKMNKEVFQRLNKKKKKVEKS